MTWKCPVQNFKEIGSELTEKRLKACAPDNCVIVIDLKRKNDFSYFCLSRLGLEIKGCPLARGTLNVLRAHQNTGMHALLAPKKKQLCHDS